jgi:hypothetical protein
MLEGGVVDPYEPDDPELRRHELEMALAREVIHNSAREELAAIEHELRRRRWAVSPELWYRERVRGELWSVQRRILQALRDHRKVAVMSCHEIGKSYIAGTAVGWWIDSDPAGDSFVVTSAPSGPQVKAILWREITRIHANAGLPGRLNKTEWYLPVPPDGHEELVAFGRKPDDYDSTAFQGIHAHRVLVVFDEACGVRGALWEAAESLIANDLSKFLAIGNPDLPDTEFAEICKPGSGWHVIQVGAFDTPNFTGEKVSKRLSEMLIGKTYVEDRRKRHAKRWAWNADGTRVDPPSDMSFDEAVAAAGPYWAAKVLGLFPKAQGPDALIPIHWIVAATERSFPDDAEPSRLGCDVGAGGDSSCSAHRKGRRVRIVHEDQNPDTMETCGNFVALRRDCGAAEVYVDKIGIGAGVVDRSAELVAEKVLPEPFVGVNVGDAPADSERFLNLRAEGYWHLRELFEAGEIDIDEEDEELITQLVHMQYKRTSHGKIQIESKQEMKRRHLPSPNRAEAVMLAFIELPTEPPVKKLKGGLL